MILNARKGGRVVERCSRDPLWMSKENIRGIDGTLGILNADVGKAVSPRQIYFFVYSLIHLNLRRKKLEPPARLHYPTDCGIGDQCRSALLLAHKKSAGCESAY